MKKLSAILALTAALIAAPLASFAADHHRKIAVQTYTFRNFTLEKTLEMLKTLPIVGVECYPGQTLSDKFPNVKVGPKMPKEAREYMKKLFKDSGLKMVAFGVVSRYDTETEKDIEAVCKFAKEMGADRVLSENPVARFPIWDKVGKKYGVTMCVHHHSMTSPNQYWEPLVLAKYTSGYDNVKANPDIGHWSLCAIDPVEGLKTLRGKYVSLHFKDQKEFGVPKNQCVVLGKGAFDMKAILSELDSQGFDGFLTLENENIASNPMPVIKECVEYLRKN